MQESLATFPLGLVPTEPELLLLTKLSFAGTGTVSSAKEMNKVKMVYAPAIKTEGKIYQSAGLGA